MHSWDERIEACDISAEMAVLAVGTSAGYVKLWDVVSSSLMSGVGALKPLGEFRVSDQGIFFVQLLAESGRRQVIIGSADFSITLWTVLGVRMGVFGQRLPFISPEEAAQQQPSIVPPTPGEINELDPSKIVAHPRSRRGGVSIAASPPAHTRVTPPPTIQEEKPDALDNFMKPSGSMELRPGSGIKISDATFITGELQFTDVPYRLDSRDGRSGVVKLQDSTQDDEDRAIGRQRARSVLAGLYVPSEHERRKQQALALGRPSSLPEFPQSDTLQSSTLKSLSSIGTYGFTESNDEREDDASESTAMHLAIDKLLGMGHVIRERLANGDVRNVAHQLRVQDMAMIRTPRAIRAKNAMDRRKYLWNKLRTVLKNRTQRTLLLKKYTQTWHSRAQQENAMAGVGKHGWATVGLGHIREAVQKKEKADKKKSELDAMHSRMKNKAK
jgi:hypothetical protein